MSITVDAGLSTVTDVARELGQTPQRVNYAILSRNIKPALRLGNYRAYDRSGVEAIASVLAEINNRKMSSVAAASP